MKARPEIKVRLPRVPNFLVFNDSRLGKGDKISVGKVPEAELRKIGAAWTEALVLRAGILRRQEMEDKCAK